MIVDILELQPNGQELVARVGQKYGGKAKGPDKDFRNGMHELEGELDGSDERKLHQLFRITSVLSTGGGRRRSCGDRSGDDRVHR